MIFQNAENKKGAEAPLLCDASAPKCCLSCSFLFLFCYFLALLFPLGKFSLPLLAFVKSKDVGQDAASDGFDFMLRDR
jgi:hypothetical protein